MSDKSELIDQLRIEPGSRYADTRRLSWVRGLMIMLPVLLAAALYWWLLWPQTVRVQVAHPQITEISSMASRASVLDASGYVVAKRLATVSSKVTGKITEVLVEEGMAVQLGQVLARLDDAIDQAQLELALAQLRSAQSSLGETEVSLQDARRSLRRQVELRTRNLTSEADADAAQTAVDSLLARLQAQRDDINVSQRNVDLRMRMLDELIIRAPFDGVVVAKAAQPGEMVSPISAGGGFTRTGICTIVDMDSLEIEVDVNEAYIQRISAAQPATAVLDAYPDWDIPAQVIAIVPTADRQKATVRVRVALLEKDNRVLPDMGVKVRFLDQQQSLLVTDAVQTKTAMLIPVKALFRESGGHFVFVVDDGILERRAVQQGELRRDQAVITAGLSANESIVADLSGVELTAGQRVTIIGEKS